MSSGDKKTVRPRLHEEPRRIRQRSSTAAVTCIEGNDKVAKQLGSFINRSRQCMTIVHNHASSMCALSVASAMMPQLHASQRLTTAELPGPGVRGAGSTQKQKGPRERAFPPIRRLTYIDRISVVMQSFSTVSGKRPSSATARPLTDRSTRASIGAAMGAMSVGASKYMSLTTRR